MSAGPKHTRRHRRWPTVVLLLAALIVAAAGVGAWRTRLFANASSERSAEVDPQPPAQAPVPSLTQPRIGAYGIPADTGGPASTGAGTFTYASTSGQVLGTAGTLRKF